MDIPSSCPPAASPAAPAPAAGLAPVLVLKQGPSSVPPPEQDDHDPSAGNQKEAVPGIANHLGGHGEEPLQDILGS